MCLLGRCECLDGWGAADCSQAWGRRGGWGGRVPPWAIALIVIGSSLLAMALLTAAAHIAELIAEAREAAEEGGDGGGGGGGEGSRQPLLLRIDGDDGGSVGSEDTASWGGDDDAEDVEGRIESVISRLEEGMHRVGGGGGGGGVLQSYTGVGPLSDIDCVVCMIRPVQSVLVPCGHLCMCRRCSRRLTRCPICRKTIARRQRLYV